MTDTTVIGAILLAAGNSSRMGPAGPKQLLPYQGQSLVRRAIDTACMSAVCPVVVVLGANAEQVRPTIDGIDVEIVENPRWETGMGSSLRTGLERLLVVAPNIGAVIVLLCDQPLVTSEDIRGLIQAHSQTGKPLVAASYAGTLGVPAVIGKSWFDRVMALPDSSGAKTLFLAGGDDVAHVEVPCAAVDIDRPEDYEKLRRCCG